MKEFFGKNSKLIIAAAIMALAFVALVGFAVNSKDPVSGVVTAFGSIARSFWRTG